MLGGAPPASLAAAAPEEGLALPDAALATAPPGLAAHLAALTRADAALRPTAGQALAEARKLSDACGSAG
jgi:hypothetical protein